MSHSGPSPVPPTQILTSRSVSQSAALDFLKAYLVRAVNDPSLQPSAMITEHGPISRTTAAAPNLTLHNLKRVQAGLVGEILGRDLSLDAITSSSTTVGGAGTQSRGSKRRNEETNATSISNNDGQWEDREKWELEQEGAFIDGDGTEELHHPTTSQEVEVDENGVPISGVLDKEERKRRKKERRQAEKKARKERAKEDVEEMEVSE